MLEISFLNVNQGDSIVVRWDKGERVGTIIIDCNLTLDGNKTINYIKERAITEIDYIILSHPHYDHYSGICDLLKYCIDASIKIMYFLFTGKTQPEYIKKISKASPQASTAINKLFNTVIDYYDADYFELASLEAGPTCDIILNEKLTLTVLSPSMYEETNFIKSIKLAAFTDSDAKNHPAANWLSTILKIHTKDWYVLLTADCFKESLKRLDTKNLIKDDNCRLKIGQSAHHGALNGHNNTFWNKRNRTSDTKIVFSVGDNVYKHPNDDVVTYFEEKIFNLHSTNSLGLLSKIISKMDAKNISNHLSTFSHPTQNKNYTSNFYGDQSFTLDEDGFFL